MKIEIYFNDKELEQRASYDPEAREELRKAVAAIAILHARDLAEARALDEKYVPQLATAGMGVFDQAYNVYMKYGGVFEETTAFAPYFGWWARQAMIEYIGSIRAPITRVE